MRYAAADHQRAFEEFYETRNWTHVSRVLEMEWNTAKRWGRPDYKCKWNCPWHNYAVLIEERDQAQQARAILLAQGVTDPAEHDAAMRDVMVGVLPPKDESGVEVFRDEVKSKTEARIAQWELLWSKLYFDATGLVLDWRQLRGGKPAERGVEEKLRQLLRGGLHATSLDQCIKNLKIVEEQVAKLRGHVQDLPESTYDPVDTVSIDEIRKMRSQLQAAPPKARLMENNAPETAAG